MSEARFDRAGGLPLSQGKLLRAQGITLLPGEHLQVPRSNHLEVTRDGKPFDLGECRKRKLRKEERGANEPVNSQ